MAFKQIFGFIVLAQFSVAASALDVKTYSELANSTIMQMDTGVVGDIDALIAMQEHLMVLGIEGGIDYLKENPDGADPLKHVIEKAEEMKSLSLSQIETMWHQGKYLRDKGIDPDKIDHFGPVMSLMDSVIHPATAYLLIKKYKETGNIDHLVQVKAELIEVLEHIKHVDPTYSANKMLAVDP